jgi:hypothetical protein
MASVDRLKIKDEFTLTFEIPDVKGENDYNIEVNEYIGGIGFQYLLIDKDPEKWNQLHQ